MVVYHLNTLNGQGYIFVKNMLAGFKLNERKCHIKLLITMSTFYFIGRVGKEKGDGGSTLPRNEKSFLTLKSVSLKL